MIVSALLCDDVEEWMWKVEKPCDLSSNFSQLTSASLRLYETLGDTQTAERVSEWIFNLFILISDVEENENDLAWRWKWKRSFSSHSLTFDFTWRHLFCFWNVWIWIKWDFRGLKDHRNFLLDLEPCDCQVSTVNESREFFIDFSESIQSLNQCALWLPLSLQVFRRMGNIHQSRHMWIPKNLSS